MNRRHISFFLPFLGLTLAATGDEKGALIFFETKIRPVFHKHCHECHSTESGKAKGGLQLDSQEAILMGGDTGPAVIPGNPEKSLLIQAVKHLDPDREMPPKSPPLDKAIIADLEVWIKNGAAFPESKTPGVAKPNTKASDHWSYQKPVAAPLPPVRKKDWPLRDIDHFVLAKIEEKGLSPSGDADPVTLLRRLHFDITGLPPTPEQAAAFSLEKWEETVDSLLNSPDFGIRWGRHWLDVARFAESNGRESNLTFPHAWRYRDYVIDAMNEDLPYDRFLQEQIAGDLMPHRDDNERARLLIATGFLAMGPKGLNEMNKKQFAADLVDEQIDTVTRAIIASSVACARCHDHKSEPFTMEDYYAMAGIFRSTTTYFGTWIDSENNNASTLLRLPDLPNQLIPNKSLPPEKVATLKADLVKLDKEEKELNTKAMMTMATGKDSGDDAYQRLANAIRIYWSRGGIEGKLATVDESGRALPLCMGVSDAPKIQEAWLYDRGDVAKPVSKIPRNLPGILLATDDFKIPTTQSGRWELARWLTSPDHPLTARVMANRVWSHLLGKGIVRTAGDFSATGEPPTHPELLDHLALTFVKNQWSVKSLIREIVLSRAYRQSSAYRADCFAIDPDNQFLWRMNKRRLDAEVIRDSMLAISGELDKSRRPGSLVAELDGQSVSLIGFNDKIPKDLDGIPYRSIYLPVIRDALPDALEQFDVANPNLVSGGRDVTNVPLQALYLLNGSFVQKQSSALAARLLKAYPDTPGRINQAFLLCYNRLPDDHEQSIAQAFLTKAEGDPSTVLAAFCQALFASAAFRNID